MQKQKNLDWNNELKQIAKWAREKKEKSKSVSFKYSLNEFRPLASSIDSSDNCVRFFNHWGSQYH